MKFLKSNIIVTIISVIKYLLFFINQPNNIIMPIKFYHRTINFLESNLILARRPLYNSKTYRVLKSWTKVDFIRHYMNIPNVYIYSVYFVPPYNLLFEVKPRHHTDIHGFFFGLVLVTPTLFLSLCDLTPNNSIFWSPTLESPGNIIALMIHLEVWQGELSPITNHMVWTNPKPILIESTPPPPPPTHTHKISCFKYNIIISRMSIVPSIWN